MNSADIITAGFEGGASIMVALNIPAILRDKIIKGVSIWPTFFFTIWGLWNLFLFWSLNMPFAAIAASSVAAVNAVWICLVLKFRHDDQKML